MSRGKQGKKEVDKLQHQKPARLFESQQLQDNRNLLEDQFPRVKMLLVDPPPPPPPPINSGGRGLFNNNTVNQTDVYGSWTRCKPIQSGSLWLVQAAFSSEDDFSRSGKRLLVTSEVSAARGLHVPRPGTQTECKHTWVPAREVATVKGGTGWGCRVCKSAWTRTCEHLWMIQLSPLRPTFDHFTRRRCILRLERIFSLQSGDVLRLCAAARWPLNERVGLK